MGVEHVCGHPSAVGSGQQSVELLKAKEGCVELADLILHIVIHKRAVERDSENMP